MKSVFIIATGLLLLSTALAQIPETLSYQGILTDAQGDPVADGDYLLVFRLYEVAEGGTALWEEKQSVAITSGVFSVILGQEIEFDLLFDRPYWLSMEFSENGIELTPRIELTSSAYSLNARFVADSSVTGKKIADGQVVRVLQISPINGFTASRQDTVRLKAGANITFDAEGGPNAGIIISATSSNNSGDGHSLDASDGNPADALFVDAEGRVGIGTATPNARLHVVNTGTGHGMRLQSNLTGFIVDEAGVDGLFITLAGRHGVQVVQAGNPSAFNNNTESNAFMVQGAEGFGLYVGHADQDGVHVESAGGDGVEVTSANGFGIRAKGSMGAAFFDGNVGIGTSSPGFPLDMGSGAHVTAGGVWTNASSRANKEGITNLSAEEALSAFKNLNPVKYRYKRETDEEYVGFIAEEVPELVAMKDRKSLSPMDIVAVMTRVLQEQQKTISKLQDEVQALKRQMK